MFRVNLKRKNTILYSFKYYKALKQNYDERFQVSIGAKSVAFVSTRNIIARNNIFKINIIYSQYLNKN
jgi:hypothetical protein